MSKQYLNCTVCRINKCDGEVEGVYPGLIVVPNDDTPTDILEVLIFTNSKDPDDYIHYRVHCHTVHNTSTKFRSTTRRYDFKSSEGDYSYLVETVHPVQNAEEDESKTVKGNNK